MVHLESVPGRIWVSELCTKGVMRDNGFKLMTAWESARLSGVDELLENAMTAACYDAGEAGFEGSS